MVSAKNCNGSTLADDAVDRNRARIFFGEAIHHAEAKAGPFLCAFGREKRRQNILQKIRCDAGPGISLIATEE